MRFTRLLDFVKGIVRDLRQLYESVAEGSLMYSHQLLYMVTVYIGEIA